MIPEIGPTGTQRNRVDDEHLANMVKLRQLTGTQVTTNNPAASNAEMKR